jgi:hypothetical protein
MKALSRYAALVVFTLLLSASAQAQGQRPAPRLPVLETEAATDPLTVVSASIAATQSAGAAADTVMADVQFPTLCGFPLSAFVVNKQVNERANQITYTVNLAHPAGSQQRFCRAGQSAEVPSRSSIAIATIPRTSPEIRMHITVNGISAK